MALGYALALAALAWALGGERLKTAWHRASPERPAKVLIVIDTLRADRLSVCGYDRPTSPTMQALIERGASLRCDAVAPGSWTVPSHASLFTGLTVPEHGAHFVEGTATNAEDVVGLVMRPLGPGPQTLAERMRTEGYQPVGVSENRVLQPSTGLSRGFLEWRVAPVHHRWSDAELRAELRGALRGLDDADGPLFLFVNLFDAHDPWGPIPEGLGWLPAREGHLVYMGHRPEGGVDPDGPWQRYVQGRMPEAEAEALRGALSDRYDYGVRQADEALAIVLTEISAHGWDAAGLELVVTSDHGEFLGEQGLLRHGRYLWEGNQRVPLLLYDSAVPRSLPAQPSGAMVGGLLLPEPPGAVERPPPAAAVAFPDRLWLEQSRGALGESTSVALWEGGRKALWMDGARWWVPLATEADRSTWAPIDGPHAELDALVAATLKSRGEGMEVNSEVLEALRAAGYVE